ncbi:putative PGG domain-containing protein [Arabidopsis thaliana]
MSCRLVIVATVTFSVGFTMAGGFYNSSPNLGMATLANAPNLFYFLILYLTPLQCKSLL